MENGMGNECIIVGLSRFSCYLGTWPSQVKAGRGTGFLCSGLRVWEIGSCFGGESVVDTTFLLLLFFL